MSATSTPCELRPLPDYLTVILHPAMTEASGSELETFRAEIRRELENREPPVCLIDLSPLTYMGSEMVALLVSVWRLIQPRGGKLVVYCVNPLVRDVIRLTGLDKILNITTDVETAQRKLGVRTRPTEFISAGHSSASRPLSADPLDRVDSPRKLNVMSFAVGVVTVLIALLVVLLLVSRK